MLWGFGDIDNQRFSLTAIENSSMITVESRGGRCVISHSLSCKVRREDKEKKKRKRNKKTGSGLRCRWHSEHVIRATVKHTVKFDTRPSTRGSMSL